MNTKGKTSWIDIRAVNGVTYDTNKAACIALDLIEYDTMWISTLTDECQENSPICCRQLFVFILLECTPSSPRHL
jgi:hypothetical protein